MAERSNRQPLKLGVRGSSPRFFQCSTIAEPDGRVPGETGLSPYNIESNSPSIYRFLGKRGVKDEICMFDARSISHDVRESVEELLKSKASSFDPKVFIFFYKAAS